MLSLSVNNKEFIAKIHKHEKDVVQRAKNVLEKTAQEAANYAKSLTSATQFPARKGEGLRKAHPGGWADDTGALATSIQAGNVKITRSDVSVEFGVMVSIDGSMEYAEVLDERDGYSVLGGADKEARKALNKNKDKII